MVGERRSPFQKYYDQIKNLKEELKKRDKELEKRDKDIIKLKKRDKEIEELQERLNQLEKKLTAPSAQTPVTSPQSAAPWRAAKQAKGKPSPQGSLKPAKAKPSTMSLEVFSHLHHKVLPPKGQ